MIDCGQIVVVYRCFLIRLELCFDNLKKLNEAIGCESDCSTEHNDRDAEIFDMPIFREILSTHRKQNNTVKTPKSARLLQFYF